MAYAKTGTVLLVVTAASLVKWTEASAWPASKEKSVLIELGSRWCKFNPPPRISTPGSVEKGVSEMSPPTPPFPPGCAEKGIPEDNPCSWPGVVCSVDGNVTELQLPGRFIMAQKCLRYMGSLPTELSALRSLRRIGAPIDAAYEGTLPRQWSELTALEIINLPMQRAQSHVVREYKVSEEGLGYNISRYQGLPDEWSALTALRVLDVSNATSLHGTLPAGWSALTGLEHLVLGRTANLADCNAYDDQPIAYEPVMGNIHGTLPEVWSTMSSLKTLNLNNHHLSGSIPASWVEGMRSMSRDPVPDPPTAYGSWPWALNLACNAMNSTSTPASRLPFSAGVGPQREYVKVETNGLQTSSSITGPCNYSVPQHIVAIMEAQEQERLREQRKHSQDLAVLTAFVYLNPSIYLPLSITYLTLSIVYAGRCCCCSPELGMCGGSLSITHATLLGLQIINAVMSIITSMMTSPVFMGWLNRPWNSLAEELMGNGYDHFSIQFIFFPLLVTPCVLILTIAGTLVSCLALCQQARHNTIHPAKEASVVAGLP